MKLKSVYLFLLLLAAAFAFPQVDSLASVAKLPGKKLSASHAAYVAPAVNAVVELRSTSGIPNGAGKQDSGRTYFKAAPAAAMHGSIAPVCAAFLNIIAILHLESPEAFPPTVNRSGQQVLFRVLFRVIISPNAP